MRYRKLDANGDMSFGHSARDFHQDSPEAVAQAVDTRLSLLLREWFLDQTDGTAWATKVLGKYTAATRNLELQRRILQTQGVLRIDAYSADLEPNSRRYAVTATITTIYGAAQVAVSSPGGFA